MTKIIRNKLIVIPQSKSNINKQLEAVKQFCRSVENGFIKGLSFEKIEPSPSYLISDSKEEDDWRLKNWGTRFKALNAFWIREDELIFDTFWNPPVPIIAKISDSFPDIIFVLKFSSKIAGK